MDVPKKRTLLLKSGFIYLYYIGIGVGSHRWLEFLRHLQVTDRSSIQRCYPLKAD